MRDIKKLWEDRRKALVEIAEIMKDSQSVSFGLLALYDSLSDGEKAAVNDLLAEWLISDDNTRRYDVEFLISQRCIKSLKTAVEKAIEIAQNRTDPGAEFDIENLLRILNELSN